MNIVFQAHGA